MCGQAVSNHNKQGKTFLCRTDECVPFAIPSVSASSGTSSSSTSPVRDLPSSSSTSTWQLLEAHQATNNRKKKKDVSRDPDERLRDLLEWFEEFTESREHGDACARTHVHTVDSISSV